MIRGVELEKSTGYRGALFSAFPNDGGFIRASEAKAPLPPKSFYQNPS